MFRAKRGSTLARLNRLGMLGMQQRSSQILHVKPPTVFFNIIVSAKMSDYGGDDGGDE